MLVCIGLWKTSFSTRLPKTRLYLRTNPHTQTRKPREFFGTMDIAHNSFRAKSNVFTLLLCILMNVYKIAHWYKWSIMWQILLLSVTLHKHRMFTHCCMHNLCMLMADINFNKKKIRSQYFSLFHPYGSVLKGFRS